MKSIRVAVVWSLLALWTSSASAQEQSKARRATPVNLGEWAVKIQQDYPVEALQNRKDGVVTMRIAIGEDGRVRNCDVTNSSGSASLDEAACRGMVDHALYSAARDHAGAPISDTVTQSIRYVIPSKSTLRHFTESAPIEEGVWRAAVFDEVYVEAIGRSESKRALYVLTIDEEGHTTGCGTVWPSGNAALDRKACKDLIANARFRPARLRTGEAVPGSYSVAYPSFRYTP